MQPDSVQGGRKAPPPRKYKMQHLSTGQVVESWPVDARDMIRSGEWDRVADDTALRATGATPAPVSVPVTPPTHLTTLEAKSYKELQALAKRAGVTAGGKAADLIAALLPLVESGVVSLEDLPKVAPDPVEFAVTTE